MSIKTIQLIIPLAIIFHGIGHIMGILTALKVISTETWHSRSWLLTNALGDTTTRIIALILWSITVIGFIAAGAGAFGWQVTAGNWRMILVVTSIVSLITLAVFWNAFAVFFPNKVGCIAFNIAALVGILMLNWPSTEIIP
ncbi:MAG: hypothetical protein JEZ00_11180 [Anaerolineaceae bacterium]|nr:hypothetical protein [Anaerolineaceae bacterium]